MLVATREKKKLNSEEQSTCGSIHCKLRFGDARKMKKKEKKMRQDGKGMKSPNKPRVNPRTKDEFMMNVHIKLKRRGAMAFRGWGCPKSR